MIICQGCGQAFPVPAGYTRNKIQCPGCGVICAVPADAERAAPAKAPAARAEPAYEDEAMKWLAEPAAAPEALPVAEPVKAKAKTKPARPKELLFPCRRCGRMIRKQRECPACDGGDEAALPENPVPALGAHALELDEPLPILEAAAVEEEDVSPYVFADKELGRCPQCKKSLPLDTVLCVNCGYNLQSRQKAVRTYEPVERAWETDYTLSQRLMLFAGAQGIHWGLAIFWAVVSGYSTWPFVVAWPLLVALMSFVLGTYDRVEVVRDRKGRTRLMQQWRFCFIPLQTKTTDVRGYEGVTTGQWHSSGFLEWFVFGSLLFVMLVPAFIWWYYAIYQMHFHVALAVDHGHADVWVYRGRSQEQMNDIADVLSNAAGIPRLG